MLFDIIDSTLLMTEGQAEVAAEDAAQSSI